MMEERFVKAWEGNAPSAFVEHKINISKVFFHCNCFWKGRFIAAIRNTWNQLKGRTVCIFSILKKKDRSVETMQGLHVS